MRLVNEADYLTYPVGSGVVYDWIFKWQGLRLLIVAVVIGMGWCGCVKPTNNLLDIVQVSKYTGKVIKEEI